jgi:hypothetical protein
VSGTSAWASTAEVDQDAAPPAAAGPRRRPLLVAAAAVAVLALVGAAGVRSALGRPSGQGRPAVTSWVGLRAVVPGTGGSQPWADLFLSVANRSEQPLTLDGLTFDGPRVAGAGPATEVRQLPAGEVITLDVRRPLRCDASMPSGRRDAGIDVRVTVGGAGVVRALPVGRLAVPDGACRTRLADLPAGYDLPVTVTAATFSAESATLRLTGLPTGRDIVGVYADGWILAVLATLDDGAGSAGGGTAADAGAGGVTLLRLGAPSPSCTDPGTRGVVPVGLQLRLLGRGVLTTAYAGVGPALARWLMDGRLAACGAPIEPGPARRD